MPSETLPSSPAVKYDARSAMAAGLCLMALFFNVLGWLLAIIGIFLLRRAVFQPRVKWILATVALAPKILFLGVLTLSAPQGLSFTIEPRTLATSSTLWSWSILLAAIGFFLLYVPVKMRRAPDAPVQPASSGTPLLKLVGLVPIALAAIMLLGLSDDFQRIEDAGNGRWALKHAVRGAVATFTRDELGPIEASYASRRRGAGSYSVRVGLMNGRTFSASTKSAAAFEELRKFAATAGLRPGTVHIRQRFGPVWTNTSGFTPKDGTGTYTYVDERSGERSTFEFWLQNGRLAGKETVVDGQRRHVQTLRDIKISDTGELEFEESSYAEAEPSKTAVSFSLRWSAQGERGRFTKDGLEIGLKKYRRQ